MTTKKDICLFVIQCTQCIFTVVVHSVQNTSQLLVVICLDFAHSGINQLANEPTNDDQEGY